MALRVEPVVPLRWVVVVRTEAGSSGAARFGLEDELGLFLAAVEVDDDDDGRVVVDDDVGGRVVVEVE